MESDLENADPTAANARRVTVPSVLAPAKRDALMQKLRDQKKKAWLAEINNRKQLITEAKKEKMRQLRSSLSAEELFMLSEAFLAYDVDQSGFLTMSELREAIRDLGYPATDHDIAQILHIADADGSSAIDKDEFITLVNFLLHPPHSRADLEKYMQIFDEKNKGFLPKEVLFTSFRSLIGNVEGEFSMQQLELMLKAMEEASPLSAGEENQLLYYRPFLDQLVMGVSARLDVRSTSQRDAGPTSQRSHASDGFESNPAGDGLTSTGASSRLRSMGESVGGGLKSLGNGVEAGIVSLAGAKEGESGLAAKVGAGIGGTIGGVGSLLQFGVGGVATGVETLGSGIDQLQKASVTSLEHVRGSNGNAESSMVDSPTPRNPTYVKRLDPMQFGQGH